MKKRKDAEAEALLAVLCENSAARLVIKRGGRFAVSGRTGERSRAVSGSLVQDLLTRGLLADAEGKSYAATAAGVAWLKRHRCTDLPFRAQHGELGKAPAEAEGVRGALTSLDESPIAALSRRRGRSGAPWLQPHAAMAGERLRSDFELGRLQPRLTTNWSTNVGNRRSGHPGGLAEITNTAISARLRFDRAIRAIGPELSGVAIDVCCFLKGLETVERERQWPARSAKLVLRLALERLASHYGLTPLASGRPSTGRLRHWGAVDYRPRVS